MTDKNNHVGSNFDNFLKENGILIPDFSNYKEALNKVKDDFIKTFYNHPTLDENYLINEVSKVLEQAAKENKIKPPYEIKRTKLPRKLKKKYKKENRICIDVKYIDYVPKCEIVIPIESEDN